MIRNININDYNYDLPDEKIAKYPLDERDMSKLLVFDGDKIEEDRFRNISTHLPAGSLLLFNDTKVINARMIFEKETGARIEVFCLDPISPSDYAQAFAQNGRCSWKCLVGNSKKWKDGRLKKSIIVDGKNLDLYITRVREIGNSFEILFEWDNPDICFSQIIDVAGNIPIPPYLNRNSEDIDKVRYQTVYSHYQGSVAAPTAGLHFTERVMGDLKKCNIQSDAVTLHVGAGTFQPVKTDNAAEHEMHTEHFIVKRTTIEKIVQYLGNITITGTTTVRTVESLFCVGAQIFENKDVDAEEFHVSQWEAYEYKDKYDVREILENLLSWMTAKGLEYIRCATQIMIVPGFRFRITDRLITNFHQPKSTLLLLLSAFIGDEWRKVYGYALENNFRFLSYGDSCLFLNKKESK
ncbi:MAG: S-adenosylmethionine:tRNA ribosyltransferase-isomerase [Bacteroidales bacterium]|nr:S-adenosylmethionine:tRNA ribosyltransferase-isomerase [Bacteroidales bacterium]MBQ2542445.1 S-adenosylmethionine:tRNA ribosyltransferase-isomerase [Bacteroidales bacterium]MBQ2573495.1 S-adenosylmethionine:tRNA ribosyltransferase-isomerase [Bacteroidales bacterium]MBQ5424624.1 S-adenosylmethionine:tRNA ribosyltransferase-isomerase [Bacteroidales bacterium]